MDRDFDSYVELYQHQSLDYEISEIIRNKIETSNPTLKKVVEIYERNRSSNSQFLKKYSLNEIIKRFHFF